MNPEDQTVFIVISEGGRFAVMYRTEDGALDHCTRKDKVYKARLVDWEPL